MPVDGDASLDPDRIRATGFSTAFRGYDQYEVRRYLEHLAEALRTRRRSAGTDGTGSARAERQAADLERQVAALSATVADLRAQLAARPEAGAAEAGAAEAGPVDQHEADQQAQERAQPVLADAASQAASIRHEAAREAEVVLADATRQAASIRAEAIREAEAARAEAERQARSMVAAAAEAAERLVADARAEARAANSAPADTGRDGLVTDGPSDRAVGTSRVTGQEPPPRLTPAEASDLDALFAKVRADRSRAVADARQLLAGDGSPAAAEVRGADPSGPAERHDAPFVERDEALAPLEHRALRQLKRAMADAQNELLDAIGRSDGGVDVGQAPDPAAQLRCYRDAVAGSVRAAFRAGSASGGGWFDADRCEELCGAVAARVADPLQARVTRVLETTGVDDDAVLDRLRATYRGFRSGELAAIVADGLAEAFALGLHRSHPTGTRLAWTPDPRVTPGSECADNARAGAVAVPEPFPSGHGCPPAGPGCRCLTLPVVGSR